jgi:hypothetical protein
MKTKPKTKAKPANQISDVCDDGNFKPRRSIPLAEVQKMIEAEVRRVKSQRTIFDDRNDILAELDRVKSELEYHDNLVHHYQKPLQAAQSHLKEINTAIKRELELGE